MVSAPGSHLNGHGRQEMRDQLCDNGGAYGLTVMDVHGRLLSVKPPIHAVLPDLIRQRS